MKHRRVFMAVLITAALSSAAWAQAQPADTSHLSDRAKFAFAAAESYTEVNLNAYYGYKEANQAAFGVLKAKVARLNEPKLLEKIEQAEKECVTKGCKYSVPPLSHAVKEWKNVEKHIGDEANASILMGTATATVDFYFRYAPKLHETLRRHMTSGCAMATNAATKACTATASCSASVREAFDELNTRIVDNSITPERAQALLKVVRDQMRLADAPGAAAK